MKLSEIYHNLSFTTEELQGIYELILHEDYDGAVAALQLLDEMGSKKETTTIESHATAMLEHLIKIQVTKRGTSPGLFARYQSGWSNTIDLERDHIDTLNPGGKYIKLDALPTRLASLLQKAMHRCQRAGYDTNLTDSAMIIRAAVQLIATDASTLDTDRVLATL